mmetsp:Transcript_8916/g.11601  ORF Transcript_8916/g.11601 Transcript_8916/m.11601 type:complete len:90 (+) Transcript_8916:1352-1621(+)
MEERLSSWLSPLLRCSLVSCLLDGSQATYSKLIARFKASCAMSVLNGLRRTVVLTILSYLVKIHVTFVILETKVVQTPFANFVTHIDSG